MSKEFMVARDGQQYGPYSQEDLLRYLNDGQISPGDLVWSEGMDEWKSLRDIREQLILPSTTKADGVRNIYATQPSATVIKKISKKSIADRKNYLTIIAIFVLIIGGWLAFSSMRSDQENEKLWMALHNGVEDVKLTPDGKLAPSEVVLFCKFIIVASGSYAKIKDTTGNYEDLFKRDDYFIDKYPSKYRNFLLMQLTSIRKYIDENGGDLKKYYVDDGNHPPPGGWPIFHSCMENLRDRLNYSAGQTDQQ